MKAGSFLINVFDKWIEFLFVKNVSQKSERILLTNDRDIVIIYKTECTLFLLSEWGRGVICREFIH